MPEETDKISKNRNERFANDRQIHTDQGEEEYESSSALVPTNQHLEAILSSRPIQSSDVDVPHSSHDDKKQSIDGKMATRTDISSSQGAKGEQNADLPSLPGPLPFNPPHKPGPSNQFHGPSPSGQSSKLAEEDICFTKSDATTDHVSNTHPTRLSPIPENLESGMTEETPVAAITSCDQGLVDETEGSVGNQIQKFYLKLFILFHLWFALASKPSKKESSDVKSLTHHVQGGKKKSQDIGAVPSNYTSHPPTSDLMPGPEQCTDDVEDEDTQNIVQRLPTIYEVLEETRRLLVSMFPALRRPQPPPPTIALEQSSRTLVDVPTAASSPHSILTSDLGNERLASGQQPYTSYIPGPCRRRCVICHEQIMACPFDLSDLCISCQGMICFRCWNREHQCNAIRCAQCPHMSSMVCQCGYHLCDECWPGHVCPPD